MRTICFAVLFTILTGYSAFSQDNKDYQEYLASKETSSTIIKFGAGTGAAFGGWYGVNAEAGIAYVSLLAGVGMTFPNNAVNPSGDISSNGKPAWQTGLRVYLAGPAAKFRPALSVFYGPVYRYYVALSDTTYDGMLMCVTPVLSCEHDIGKPGGIVLTYGIGPVLHKSIPERAENAISSASGKQTLVTLSLNLGINYQLRIKGKKA